jgi:tetratricopeptide (TPR) repeat protein
VSDHARGLHVFSMALRLPTSLRTVAKRRDLLLGVPALVLLLAGLTGYVYYPTWKASRHWKQAGQALESRDFAQARLDLENYLAIHPAKAEARFLLARTLRRAGQFDKARTALARAARLDWVPEQIELEETLQQVQERGVHGSELERLTAYVYAGHPDARLILEAMVQGDRDNLRLDQARKWLNLWVERFPDDWLARLWRAEHFQAFSHLDEARTDYLKLLELRPDYDEAHLRLGLLALANRSNVAEAETHLKQYLARHPDHAEAELGLARVRRDQGDLDAAAAAVKKVLDRHVDHAEAALLGGTVEAELGRYETALPLLGRAEAGGADPQATHFQLARVLKQLGKAAEAEAHERRFQELQKAEPALEKALLALLHEPGDAARHFDVGRLYADTGRGAKAERYFLAALRIDPAHRPSHEALAEFYARSDRPEHASLAELHRRLAKGK